jgi:hypothetical protein
MTKMPNKPIKFAQKARLDLANRSAPYPNRYVYW